MLDTFVICTSLLYILSGFPLTPYMKNLFRSPHCNNLSLKHGYEKRQEETYDQKGKKGKKKKRKEKQMKKRQ